MAESGIVRKSPKLSTLLFIGAGVLYLVAAAITVVLVNFHMRQEAIVEAEAKARIILDRNLATHTYFSHNLKPNLFKLTNPLVSANYFDPAWMSSTYAVREIDKHFKGLSPEEYYYKECAINARSPENEANEYEKAFLEELNRTPDLKKQSSIRTLEDKPYLVVLRRGEVMEEACLRCHSTPDQAPLELISHYGSTRSFGRSEGELVSAISIRIPLSAAYINANQFSYRLSAFLLMLLALLFFTQYLLSRRLILKPISMIRDKALSISGSDEHLGEKIPMSSGEELMELTQAFNTMSTSLRVSKDHLEEQIELQTKELAQANEQLKQEIEARTQATEALQESEERYRTLAENAVTGIYVRRGDQLLFANKRAVEISGYTEKELQQMPMLDIIHPDDRELIINQMDRRESSDGPPERFEYRGITKSGDIRWIETYGTQVVYERKPAVLSNFIDITDRKRIEEELEKSEDLYRRLVDSMLAGVYTRKGDRFLFVNKRMTEITGYTEEELLNKPILELFHPDDKELAKSRMTLWESGKGTEEFHQYRIIKKGGEFRWVETFGAQVEYDGMPAVMSTCIDITDRKRAEDELEKSEERYRTLVDHSLAGVYVRQGEKFIFVNRKMAEVSGYTEEELLDKPALDLIHPDDKEIAKKKMVLRETGESPPRFSHQRIVRKDGTIRWVETFGVKIEYDGKPAVLTTCVDISDRKRTEKELEESEERYRSLVDNSLAGVYVRQGERFLFVNKKMTEITGYPENELLDKALLELIHPEDKEGIKKKISIWDSGTMLPQFSHQRIIKKNGETCWTETSGVKIEYDGKPATLATCVDITDRKRAEKELEESEGRYRTLAESSLSGIYVRQGANFRFVNSRMAEVMGYSKEELLEKPFLELIHPDDIEISRERGERRMRGGKTTDPLQVRAITKAGDVKWVEIIGTTIDYEGEPALMGSCIDITERKQAEEERKQLEEQLQFAQRMESIGILAGGVAHDFNNLLTSILGNAELALMRVPKSSRESRNVAEIRTAALKAADLCAQMLAYSGKGQFLVKPLSFTDIIKEMSQLLESSASQRATLRYKLDENISLVEADTSQIQQIIMNLVANASEALGDEGGYITIETGVMECEEQYLADSYLGKELSGGRYSYLEVKDTGCGISEDVLEKVFDPFFTTKFAGRGLGLSAVLGIVRSHEGAIRINSEPGVGTVIRILLPYCSDAEETIKKEKEGLDQWSGAGTILLVDDEEMVLTVGTEMLKSIGFDILTATDGQEAVEIFQKHRDQIVLVLLDLTMPGMSGEKVFDEIRRIEKNARIVLSSGYAEEDAVGHFTGKDLSGFIQKPYKFDVLKEKLRIFLDG